MSISVNTPQLAFINLNSQIGGALSPLHLVSCRRTIKSLSQQWFLSKTIWPAKAGELVALLRKFAVTGFESFLLDNHLTPAHAETVNKDRPQNLKSANC
jgi:hypothetical protein